MKGLVARARQHPRVSLGVMAGILLVVASVALPPGSVRQAGAANSQVGRVHADAQPTHGKIFVLVIGTDARHGNPTVANGDALHLVGVNTHTMKAGVLNFPRDCWVNIPGHGTGKINSSLADGGPKLVAKTIESITHIKIDYYLMTGFNGFQGALHSLGNLRIVIPTNVEDRGFSGANLQAGVHYLPGYKVLQYARARHPFPHGDLDRTNHQGDILKALQRKLVGEVSHNPGSLMKWIAVAQKYTLEDLSAAELFHLGILASQIKPHDIGNVNVPVSLGSVGAASVDFIKDSEASRIYSRFRKNASL